MRFELTILSLCLLLSSMAVKALGIEPNAPCNFEIDLTGEPVNCFGESNGIATIEILQVGSFTGPYVIEWFDGNNSLVRNDLPAGTHFVKITDNVGCFIIEFITIDQPALLEIDLLPENIKCNGEADGSIDLLVSGGIDPYDIVWSNAETSEDINTLLAGNYSVTVTDANGCIIQGNATLTEPGALQISTTVVPVSCNGGADGEILTQVFGGVQPYRYAWTTGDTISNVISLPAGNQTLTVTDANNCVEALLINVPEPDPIGVVFTVKDLNCFEAADGEILAQISGGTPPYSYQWSNSGFVLGDTTNNPTGLISDHYLLEVADANGCVFLDSAFIDQPNPMVINLEATDATCFNKPDGSIDLTVGGGSPPYAILWSNNSINEDISGLLSNNYQVVVTDLLGCTQFGNISVGQPDSLVFGAIINEVSCKDQDDGKISLNPNGGTPDYSVDWSNGAVDFDLTDLQGGNYSVVLTDANSCIYEATYEVVINPRDCITLITIPNTFSPNGDGINDLWNIENSEVYPTISVQVFNKWGERLFSNVGYNEPWNGLFNGGAIQVGLYYYIVNLNNGDAPFTGTLTIIR